MSDLVNKLRDYASWGAEKALVNESADLIEQQQLEIDNLTIQADAALKISGWMKQVAFKSGWSPSEAISDADAVVGYVGMLEQERDALAAHVGRLKPWPGEDAIDWVNRANITLNQSPRYSLAEHDAGVARKAFIDGFMASFEGFNSETPKAVKYVRDRESIEYAERVKRGEV